MNRSCVEAQGVPRENFVDAHNSRYPPLTATSFSTAFRCLSNSFLKDLSTLTEVRNFIYVIRYLDHAKSCGGPSLCFANVPEVSGFRCGGSAFFGSRDRRQYGHFHADRSAYAAPAAREAP